MPEESKLVIQGTPAYLLELTQQIVDDPHMRVSIGRTVKHYLVSGYVLEREKPGVLIISAREMQPTNKGRSL
jgi:hypothetical protein